MRSESPEERGRQKAAEPPSYRIENEYNPEAIPQYFQISVGILEGKNFNWLNPRTANSYVVVILGKKKYRTSLRRNKQEPHYKEYFKFSLYVSVYDLQRSTLCLTVMEPRCCAPPHLLGEANIDLGVVLRQPYSQTISKWTQLSLPREPTAGSMGFLKVDISITSRGGIIMPPVTRDNNIDVNYLLSSGSEQQQANFMITIHGALGLLNTSRHQNDKYHHPKPPTTFVRVLFCGLQAKTAVQSRTNNPMYNEHVALVEMFPSSSPILRFEICSADTYNGRLLASKSLNLNHISHDGENGFLPTFGPSLLPMFGSSTAGSLTPNGDSPFYRGSLLISLSTIVPYYQQSLRSVSMEPAVPISVENLWTSKNFCIFCPIFEVSMLDSRLVSEFCGIAITIGEIPTETTQGEDFTYMMNEIKTRKLHYTGSLGVLRTKSEFGYVDFSHTYPVLQSTVQLPDYRFRMYRNNTIYRIVCTLRTALKKVESRLKDMDYTTPKDLLEELNRTLNDVATNISLYSKNNSCNTYENVERGYKTELDKKQLILQIERMRKIRQEILQKITSNMTEGVSRSNRNRSIHGEEISRRTIKCLISEMRSMALELEKLIFKSTEGWPDIVMWLLNGGSRIGFCKIPAADIIYSNVKDECGERCGRIQSINFKPLKCSKHTTSLSIGCFCDVGKVEFLAWMGLHEQTSAFEPCLPNGYKLQIKDFEMYIKCNGTMVDCRIYIYKARLLCNNVGDNLGHVFMRINVLNTAQNSKAIEKSSTPLWKQLLRFKKMIYHSSHRLFQYPPVVLVEVNSIDLLGKTELIGSFQIKSVIEDTDAYIPKLRWCDMYKGMENTGKVLMAVQIILVSETFLKSTIYTTFQECYVASDMKELKDSLSITELMPTDFVPRTSTYKLDIYWWGLRNVIITKKPCAVLEVEDLVVKSDIIIDKKSNCNFPNGRVSQMFEASYSECFCPLINLKLYDNSTFGRTLHIGTSVVKNPNKFFTNWYPKVEREASLKRASIMSAGVVKVSQTQHVKKKVLKFDDSDEYHSHSETNSKNIRMKRSFWRRVFCKKEPDEEEYTLLPSFTEKCANKTPIKTQILEKKDWWSRYLVTEHAEAKNGRCRPFINVTNLDVACTEEIVRAVSDLDVITLNCAEGENVFCGDKFIIYDSELELQPQFSKFKDWCTTLKLYNGKQIGISEKQEEQQCGFLKAGIAIYNWPPPDNTVAVSAMGVDLNQGFFHDYANNVSARFLVRVYLIKGIDLITKNSSGMFHPFVIISCGNKQLGDQTCTVPNTTNPIFGTTYELRCTLPEEYQLTISLYNHDLIEPDELIGSTTVDLENRVYTKHRARVGLSSRYNLFEPGKWRDCVKPSTILEEICAKNHLSPPSFQSPSTVLVNGVEYKDFDYAKRNASPLESRENVCLSLLRNWDNLPVCGYALVPEHVETRTLYNPDIPGLEQGKIHMWIDIFPIDSGSYIPPAVDITPRKTEEYELKITILKVKLLENELKETSRTLNLYVRVWPGFVSQMQNTNCRSVSSDGYYIFNWSMMFSFNCDYAGRKLVKKEKNQFTDFEENVKPELNIQIMDSDSLLSLDEPIGNLTLNLNEMPQGERKPEFAADYYKRKIINLFYLNFVRAWWSLKTNDDINIVGAIELELTLLPKQKTLVMPAGLGRDLRSSSTQNTDPRLQRNSSPRNFNLKNFFYKHNALWGSLTGIFLIIFSFILLMSYILLIV